MKEFRNVFPALKFPLNRDRLFYLYFKRQSIHPTHKINIYHKIENETTSPEEEEEYNKLKVQFASWDKKEVEILLNDSEKYGRTNYHLVKLVIYFLSIINICF